MGTRDRRALCSPARCAVQTANALGLHADIDDALRDIDYGNWRGKRLHDPRATCLPNWARGSAILRVAARRRIVRCSDAPRRHMVERAATRPRHRRHHACTDRSRGRRACAADGSRRGNPHRRRTAVVHDIRCVAARMDVDRRRRSARHCDPAARRVAFVISTTTRADVSRRIAIAWRCSPYVAVRHPVRCPCCHQTDC